MSKLYRYLKLTLLLGGLTVSHGIAGQILQDAQPDNSIGPRLSLDRLQGVTDSLERRGTKKLLIIERDKVLIEWFAEGWHDTTRTHYSASLAKAMVGGTVLLLALEDGIVHPDMPACNLIPSWKQHPQKSKITLRQLATHTSGLEDAEVNESTKRAMRAAGQHTHMDLPGWKGQFWRKNPNPFTVSRDSAEVLFIPGTHYNYSNPGMAMLSYALAAAFAKNGQDDLRRILSNRIFEPLGIKKEEVNIGYGETYTTDGLALVPVWGGGAFTANAVARVARLLMQHGRWEGHQLLDSAWISRAIRYENTAVASNDSSLVSESYSLRTPKNAYPATTMGWYHNIDRIWKYVPSDAFVGAGAGHQILLVIPSLDLVVVRFGADLRHPGDDLGFWSAVEKYLFEPIMDAIQKAPYPPSEVVNECTFGPPSETIRMAEGSDNFPMTWAHDDNLYTAYGDGWGFKPYVDIKLSLGLCKISGSPPGIRGQNIRTNGGERVGQGKYGLKASGMLAVNDKIYMLARNADNAQLAWSDDFAQHWQWADWRFTESFGCPTFLNYGKNYSGARDGYVYIYSPDVETAYQVADRMVLARVPKEKLSDQFAYEYFAGLDAEQAPIWTENIKQRRGVFSSPGQCYRSGISFNSGLGKYLYCQIIPRASSQQGPRFAGGFGIFESDHPWGPWHTVYYTRDWDIGPGESMCLPTKWFSNDGKSGYVVFSGDDYFSVRQIFFNE